MAPNIGIKCKKTPALFAPIYPIPLIQKKKEASPGNNTTYAKVRKKGLLNWILFPKDISIINIGIKKSKPDIDKDIEIIFIKTVWETFSHVFLDTLDFQKF